MAKTFRTWLGDRPPRVLSKFGDAQLYQVVSSDDGVYSVGDGPGQGRVSEIVIKWTWREKPLYPDQFTIRFNKPGATNAPVFPIRVGAGNIQRYAGEHVEGATSFTLLVNKTREEHKATWKWSNSMNTIDLDTVQYSASYRGPIMASASGLIKFVGTHEFLEPADAPNIALVVYQSKTYPFGGTGLNQTVYADEFATLAPGGISLGSYYGLNNQEEPWQDKFVDIFVPPFGTGSLYSGSDIGLEWDHAWTMSFLFQQEITCPITAYDFQHPLPLTSPVTTDTVNNITTADTKTKRGLFADRAMMGK